MTEANSSGLTFVAPTAPVNATTSAASARTTAATNSTTSGITSSASQPQPKKGVKTVYLIRHAHSLENQRIASVFSCLGDLRRFALPKPSDLSQSLELCSISKNVDAPVSELGKQQIAQTRQMLDRDDFVRTHNIQLIAHSPLARAAQTCFEMLGHQGGLEPQSTPSSSSSIQPRPRCVSLDLLLEKNHSEWIPGNAGPFLARVQGFESWLDQQPEQIVCIVGHSQFFKQMLGLPFKFSNCSVYQVEFDPQNSGRRPEPILLDNEDAGGMPDYFTLRQQWFDLKRLYHCHADDVNGNKNDSNSGAFPDGDDQSL